VYVYNDGYHFYATNWSGTYYVKVRPYGDMSYNKGSFAFARNLIFLDQALEQYNVPIEIVLTEVAPSLFFIFFL